MADIQKRTKKARKQAAKRAKKTRKRALVGAKTTRKAVEKTSLQTRAKALGLVALGAGALTGIIRLVKGGGGDGGQRYTTEPDNLPNEPTRPAATTPPPGAGTRETGSDTGSVTETERARLEQTQAS